jgi:hypothetical protein
MFWVGMIVLAIALVIACFKRTAPAPRSPSKSMALDPTLTSASTLVAGKRNEA